MDFPLLYRVRQKFPVRRLADIRGSVLKELEQSGFAANLKPGSRIAIGAGSRGISNIATIVGAVVSFWKSRGFEPFIFPAMGSHGAATAEGQADVLAHYGIHEATMGCPVISSLDVVSLGRTPQGIEAFFDKSAFDADAVMLVNRVKWHTDFSGKLESGIFKMMAIGIGKFAGAKQYHTFAYRMGLEEVIRSVGRKVLDTGKILGGLAILEDANHDTAQVTAVRSGEMESKEEALLALTKSWMGHIPMPLDILIVDEIGKNISGAGMDTKVVNRSVYGDSNPWPETPHMERVFVRSLNNLSYGNAVGLGMADIIHDRVLENMDWNATLINALTASSPANARTPIHFSTDRECLERIAPTVGLSNAQDVRIGWIRNSFEIAQLGLSANLRAEIDSNPLLEIVGEAEPLPFDGEGNLPDFVVSSQLAHA